jgi:hypothetical protein
MISTSAPLSAFILSDNAFTIEATKKVLESHRFRVTTAEQASGPVELCRRTRYDLAVYDEDCATASELAVNQFPSAPHVVLKLVGKNKVHHPPSARFHFLVQKPFTGDLFDKTIRAAYGLVALGRRASFRQPVSIMASSSRVVHEGNTDHLKSARIINVSYAGMCVETPGMLPQGAQIDLSFPASELGTTINVRGTVAWAHISGRAGIKLVKENSLEERAFETWLASILPATDEFLPAIPNQPWHLRQLKTSPLGSFPLQKTFSPVVNCAEARPREKFQVGVFNA